MPKLEESQRLDPAMGTQYRLAERWEKLGRTASAWALFRQVVSEAQAAGRDDRAATSATRATALESRLTRILISWPGYRLEDVRLLTRLSQTKARAPIFNPSHEESIASPGPPSNEQDRCERATRPCRRRKR